MSQRMGQTSTLQTLQRTERQPQEIAAKKALFELDVLRIVGMTLILFEHARPYLGWDPRVWWLFPSVGGIGLTIFFFLSGFLLRRSQLMRRNSFDAVRFLKSRLVRIFPLYWLAIAAFTVVFHYAKLFKPSDFAPLPQTLLAHAAGIQLFVSPHIFVIFTIWYMGALIPYYLVFALTARLSIRNFLLSNGLILAGVYGLKLVLDRQGIEIIDTRLLLHFPTFLAGAYYAHLDPDCALIRRYKYALAVGFFALMLAIIRCQGQGGFTLDKVHFALDSYIYYLYCLLGGMVFAAIAFSLSNFARRFPKTVALLSVSSYAVYLFHRPLYSVFYIVFLELLSYSVPTRTLLYPFATLFVVVVSYGIARVDLQWFKPTLTKFLSL